MLTPKIHVFGRYHLIYVNAWLNNISKILMKTFWMLFINSSSCSQFVQYSIDRWLSIKWIINLVLINFQSMNKGCSCRRKVESVKKEQHSNTEVVDTGSGMETHNHTNGMAVTVIRMDTRLWPPPPTPTIPPPPPSHIHTNLAGYRDINVGRG